ncbi:hypothetical protein LP419_11165 [Massilia sp. H-1]|nr:hypothetical protein LP419_11165 [Massilia sp. H-1]
MVGHTDNQGDLAANMVLSQKRAQAVVDALAGKYGIACGRLIARCRQSGAGRGQPRRTGPRQEPAGRTGAAMSGAPTGERMTFAPLSIRAALPAGMCAGGPGCARRAAAAPSEHTPPPGLYRVNDIDSQNKHNLPRGEQLRTDTHRDGQSGDEKATTTVFGASGTGARPAKAAPPCAFPSPRATCRARCRRCPAASPRPASPCPAACAPPCIAPSATRPSPRAV